MQSDEPRSYRNTATFFKDLLAHARDMAFIVAIFLYFSGFMYRYMYRQVWGITSSDADPQFFGYLVYSELPIQFGWQRLVLIVVLAGALLLIAAALTKYVRWAVILRPIIVSIAIVSLFVALIDDSRQAAILSLNRIRRGYAAPGATIVFNDAAKARDLYPASFLHDNAQGVVFIVEETKNGYYVLDQQGLNDKFLPDGKLMLVPKADVKYILSDIVAPGQAH